MLVDHDAPTTAVPHRRIVGRDKLNALLGTAMLLALTTTMLTACEKPKPPAALTLAINAASSEPAPSIASVTDLLVPHALDALYPKDGAIQIVTQGSPEPVVFDLTPMRGKEVEAEPTKAEALVEEHLSSLEETISTAAATTAGLDTFAVYDHALQETPDGGTVIMLGSGMSTVDPVDLTHAGDWMLNPKAFVTAINARDIPVATGRHIVWVGLGYANPSSRQPTAGPAARTALRIIWAGICRRSKAASCTILDGPAGTRPTTADNDVPLVKLDAIKTHCVGTTTISTDIAFQPDSSTLLPAADKQLRPLARALNSCPADRVINAIGHAAEVPGGGDGNALSYDRAAAVLDRLRALGAPHQVIGTATGLGSTIDQPVDNTPNGIYNERLARLNRVVELMASTRP